MFRAGIIALTAMLLIAATPIPSSLPNTPGPENNQAANRSIGVGHQEAIQLPSASVINQPTYYLQNDPRPEPKEPFYKKPDFWVAVATLALVIATLVLAVPAWLGLRDARRIGEAQVRAYVSVPSATLTFLDMGVGPQPVVSVMLKNSGSSPARHLGWNVTVQFVNGQKQRTRSLIANPDPKKWARTHDVAASDTIPDRAIVTDMLIERFAEGMIGPSVGVRFKVSFVFMDVFDRETEGEAYFLGLAQRASTQSNGSGQVAWIASISPSAKPNDWDGPDSD